MLSGNGRHRRPGMIAVRRAVATAGILGMGAVVPLMGATSASAAGTQPAVITAPAAPAAPAPAAAYTVKAGDTLSRIAQAQDVDGGWKALYEINRDVLAAGPDMIKVGQKLRLAGSSPKPPAEPGAGTTQAAASTVAGKGAQAVAFARAQLGKPYAWGASGPGAYDCSGLVQAAWKSAGVSLPRITTDQFRADPRVAVSDLKPGDLVFFYSSVSHVGIYIGDGRMIHAPNPSSPVEIAPIDEMPIAGATRPA